MDHCASSPSPPPTTAEVQDLAVTIASRLTERLAAASEEEGNYLDPDLAALCEALVWSRNAPAGTRDLPRLEGMGEEGREEDGLRGKPLCASVAGFSLHAAQSVAAAWWESRVQNVPHPPSAMVPCGAVGGSGDTMGLAGRSTSCPDSGRDVHESAPLASIRHL